MAVQSNETYSPAIQELIQNLDEAVSLHDVPLVTQEIKQKLQRFSGQASTALPARFFRPCSDTYARRLLYRHGQEGYTVVVMTWGPGQRTELHDHAGIWCVECVIQGQLDVTQYDLLEERAGRCRFVERKSVRAVVGDAGCLIPPFEYHVLGNALDRGTTITLHVYGGEMDRCNCYRPETAGWWERCAKRLSYTD